MKMRSIVLTALASMMSVFAFASTRVDVYQLKMLLDVPRVYDNMSSDGYRKIQKQCIYGKMSLTWSDEDSRPTITISELVNRTHKLSNGKNVQYDVAIDYDTMFPRLNAIGSNKTSVFKKAVVNFSMIADPVSYSIWDEATEDNSLILSLAGSGNLAKKKDGIVRISSISGFAVGTLGCGCKDYGHVSPTRVIGRFGPLLDEVDDVAAVYGKWTAKFEKSCYCK